MIVGDVIPNGVTNCEAAERERPVNNHVMSVRAKGVG